MRSRRVLLVSFAVQCLAAASGALAQSPGALYTWDGTGDAREWFRNFGTNTVSLDNGTAGELTIIETGAPGSDVAISDGFNRVRESPTGGRFGNPSGGLDLTGLDFLEFELGHNGAGSVNVQFFVQASPANSYRALGPDLAVAPGGVSSYQVPLSGLTPNELVYVRTLGFNARDHAGLGNLTWTVREVRSGGTPLTERTLVTHDTGAPEGGLQGAQVNFDGVGVEGNTGQNQTGLRHNPAGSGSLEWTDLGGGPGGAISWGNGTALNGNSFNNRTTDLSNYAFVTITMSATAAGGGSVDVQAFFQKNGFDSFQTAGSLPLAIDGQFHDLTFPLAGLTHMNVVDQTGVNLGAHPQNLVINVDSVRFVVPEPASGTVLSLAAAGCVGIMRRKRARV